MSTGTGPSHHHGTLIATVIAAMLGITVGGAAAWFAAPRGAGESTSQGPDASGGMGGGMPPATVRVGTVEERALRERFDVVGRLEELRRAVVASEVEGRVLDVPIEAGDAVVGGETVLAEIDGVWSKLALRQAEAGIASAEAALDQARRDHEYLRALQATGSAKPKEVEDAATRVASQTAAMEAARTALETARQRVQRLKILAPFDGAVVERLVERGQWVNPGSPVAQVITTGRIDAKIHVPEQHVGEVAVGQTVDVTVQPLRQRVTGQIVAVVPSAANAARTFPVRVRLDDQGGLLKAGMSVTAHLPVSDERPRLTVPRDAVLFSGDEATVWVAAQAAEGPTRAALPVPVRVTFGVEDRYVVQPLGATLENGAAVVVLGGERLSPGQPLMIDPGSSSP